MLRLSSVLFRLTNELFRRILKPDQEERGERCKVPKPKRTPRRSSPLRLDGLGVKHAACEAKLSNCGARFDSNKAQQHERQRRANLWICPAPFQPSSLHRLYST